MRAVAGRLDRADELARRSPTAAPCTVACVGREVDGRLDAVEPVQAALDPRRARGARHALEVEPDFGLRAHGSTIERTPYGYEPDGLARREPYTAHGSRLTNSGSRCTLAAGSGTCFFAH